MSLEGSQSAETQAYARFPRRLRSALFDYIVLVVTMICALAVISAFESDHIARILGIVVVTIWLLYEPLLVSITGGTPGHHIYNMRVVDDRGGNISFFKALFRVAIKTFLGWLSFFTMALTSRHQAVHDLLTKSTVQIRNIAKAEPHHFNIRRDESAVQNLPSRTRRVLVILAYLFGTFIIQLISLAVLALAGFISFRCLDRSACSAMETIIENVLSLVWIGLVALVLILGWRGRLWGARAG